MNQEPIRIYPENLAVDTMMFIGAWQVAYILIKGYPLPIMLFKTQREVRVFDVLINGYLTICEEIYDAIKENDERKRSS